MSVKNYFRNFLSYTLTNGLVRTDRIPSQGLIRGILIDVAATTTGGSPADVTLYNVMGLLNRVILRVNGTQLVNLPGGPGTVKAAMQATGTPPIVVATTTPGAMRSSWYIPCSLPAPFKRPFADISGLPAGLMAEIQLEVQVVADMLAQLSDTTPTSYSAGPTLNVMLDYVDMTPDELRAMNAALPGGFKGFVQTYLSTALSSTGESTTFLQAVQGDLVEVWQRAVDSGGTGNGSGSDTLTTNCDLILNQNDRIIDSTHLLLQAWTRQNYPQTGSAFGVSVQPAGTWLYPTAHNGDPAQLLSLRNLKDIRLTTTVATSPSTARIENIQTTLQDDFYRSMIV